MLPVALDAMGGDKAPDEIRGCTSRCRRARGARRPRRPTGSPRTPRGRPGDHPCLRGDPHERRPCSSVRRMKDSSLVRAAEAVRDGHASAMISAGERGPRAIWRPRCCGWAASRGCHGPRSPLRSPCRATPRRAARRRRQRRVPAETWLLQFAQMGAVFARDRYGRSRSLAWPCSRSARRRPRARPLVKETHALLSSSEALAAAGAVFVGNVEGRDVMTDEVDVIVTENQLPPATSS